MMNLNGERGFTLIELMIVIAIIGILAAVAIPQLTGVRDQANAAAVKSELKNIQTELELYYTTHDNSYPEKQSDFETALNADMTEAPDGSTYSYTSSNNEQDYTVQWTNPNGDNLQVTPDGGITTF